MLVLLKRLFIDFWGLIKENIECFGMMVLKFNRVYFVYLEIGCLNNDN